MYCRSPSASASPSYFGSEVPTLPDQSPSGAAVWLCLSRRRRRPAYPATRFAAAIAARTPDSSRIALIFALASLVSGRRAAMYRPCCW